DVGVDTLMSGLLTLRPGRQKDFYLERLAARTAPVARSAVDPVASDPSAEPTHPTPEVLLRRYAELYQENRPSGAPIASYSRRLSALCSELCQRYGVDAQIPHRLFKGRMGPADEAYLLLRLMEPLYRRRGVDVRPLVAGTGRYAAWLDQERRTFNRRRSLPATWVDDRFRELAADGGTRLADLLQNAKLAHFVRRATGEGSCFNALNLALEPCPGGAARGTP
ncbi:hypothetical protein, partial [Salinispira pacifica]